ncbi:MAG TPA: hypothetical protein VF450_12515 [Noviherbaspirillum sp.]
MRPAEKFLLLRRNDTSIIQWILLTIFCIAGAILWTWFAGKDLNWDSRNYHFYAAYQWTENRLSKDFMAASLQSYFNPLGYLPFYWMVRANLHSLVIGTVLAVIHAINLLLVAAIASSLIPSTAKWRFTWIVLSVLVAAINPVFATEVGSTFIDITTSIFVLAAYALCIRWLTSTEAAAGRTRHECLVGLKTWTIAGLILGIACGLKLTNAIYAVALWLAIFGKRSSLSRYIHRTLCYAAGGIVGFVIINGCWAWHLYQEFGNPVFPLANAFFKSPDFQAFNIKDTRFIPESFFEALVLPVRALIPEPNIYVEVWAPDVRFCALFALLVCTAIKFAWNLTRSLESERTVARTESRAIILLMSIWILSYVLWLYTSGNARYFIPSLLMMGPLIVALSLRLVGAHRFAIYILAFLLFWQVAFESVSQHRWSPSGWTNAWFEVRVPKKLAGTPYLYLSPTIQTATYLVPFLHPGSAFSNIGGQVPIARNSPGGKRVETMIRKYGRHIRSLIPINPIKGMGDVKNASLVRSFDGIYERFGLQTDPASCETIEVMDSAGAEPGVGFKSLMHAAENDDSYIPGAVSCILVPRSGPGELDSDLARRIDRIFDRIEKTCPRRFSPAAMVTKKFRSTWARSYFNSATTLFYTPENDELAYAVLGGATINMGKLNDWEGRDPPHVDCSVKKGFPSGPEASRGARVLGH